MIKKKRDNSAGVSTVVETKSPVRCAIYTRKSNDENLDNGFNSLDAQREAAENYIRSQQQEGWVIMPERYDDAGHSGATLDRPALQQLLTAVKEGRIDTLVVYKIDRLSRSLLDFAKLIEFFEAHNVSFVSITQQFSTTTSMGRLTLNILLSFAEFERAVCIERIKDKIAASKRRGQWLGGVLPLGYDLDRPNKRLVINEIEAKLVRIIFQRFIEIHSTTKLARELNELGYRTKSWVTVAGKKREGVSWHIGHLYKLLNNPLYIGLVRHKDQTYPGEHQAIIEKAVWEKAHTILTENHRVPKNATRAKTPALLRGLVRCGHCSSRMGITYSRKKNSSKTYRYYLCVQAAKRGRADCPVKSVAAGEIEAAVVEQLRGLFRDPGKLIGAAAGANGKSGLAAKHRLLAALDAQWENIFPAEQERIVRLLIEQVTVNPDGLEIVFRPDGFPSLVEELSQTPAKKGNGR